MIILFLILGFTFLVFLVIKNGRRPKNYPPGPFPLPIIGNLHQLSPEPYNDYVNLRKVYGDIFSVDIGSLKSVIISDYKLIKEAFAHTNVSARPELLNFLEPETGLKRGIFMTEGREWTEQRGFVLRTLRDFGFGKGSMESLYHEEIKEVIEDLKKEIGKPISMSDRFNIAVFNALWTLVAGERHSHSESKIQTLVHKLTSNTEEFNTSGIIVSFPWFAKLMPEYSGLNALMRNNIPVYDFMREVIATHKQTQQPGFNRDLLDCYLEQMKQCTDPQSSFYGANGDSHLVMTLYNLFIGGTETTSTTLVWIFLMLARHPDVQEKLNREINDAIGDDRLPSLSDKQKLPYLEAVLLEVWRFSALSPLNMRKAVEDIEFHGYIFPKGTCIAANYYSVSHDKKIWGDPENFRPERFLIDDGTLAMKKEALMPFGSGRRFCPGESLAREQVFLFAACLFQRFKVSLAPNQNMEKIEVLVGTFFRIPKVHKLILQDRFEKK